ncbi:hypothetical protein EJ04DRAFT_558098 [Polyplosphaeria fusca]|uniref:Myb-like domain-containing protein n=1 Tax=Polyplosphaeria fusca TaxID=682080 RepID=A0A9P4RAW0_9PLEO|nr:hypothetical protein EJ04DRAFT_558098 [Polyplosphaeria fusca]
MPKADKAPAHRNSISAASAAGGGGVRSSSWSAKDDETLIAARAQGLNWNQIAPKHFPSKTPNACRKRHERLMERQNAEQWDGVKLDVLAQAYMEVRRDMWGILAARVNEKWQVVEQKCMEKGLKNLAQAYRSSQRKQGTVDGHYDSGIGVSDLEEESDERPVEGHDASESSSQYQGPFTQQRVPSIQSMLAQYPSLHHNQQQQY